MKFEKISQKILDDFWNARIVNDATNKAIEKAQRMGFKKSDYQSLIAEKLRSSMTFKQKKDEIESAILVSNLVQFNEHWFGILCDSGKHAELLVYPLITDNLKQIYVEPSFQSLPKQTQLQDFLNTNMDRDALYEYKNLVLRKQDELLNNCLSYVNTVRRKDQTYYLSSHCLRRWNERIHTVSKKVDNNGWNKIAAELEKSFARATYMYTSDFHNGNLYLDRKRMVFYIVGDDNVIITLWKKQFGFSKKVDDECAWMQLKVMKEKQKRFYATRERLKKKIGDIEEKQKRAKYRMELLNSSAESLSKRQATMQSSIDMLGAEIEKYQNELNQAEQSLIHDEDIIFKNSQIVIYDETKSEDESE